MIFLKHILYTLIIIICLIENVIFSIFSPPYCIEHKYECNSVVQEGTGGSLSTGKVPQRPKRVVKHLKRQENVNFRKGLPSLNVFWTQILLIQIFFKPKICLEPNYFWTKIFFMNQNISGKNFIVPTFVFSQSCF